MFLSFEGIEGCGKSTQVARLSDFLRQSGIAVTVTREPGGSPLGPQLRALLLSESYAVCPSAELLLYGAERAEHVAAVIRPVLARGEWLLCDRYGDATRAYQCWGRGLSRQAVEEVHAIASGGLEPDLTVWLRLDSEVALARARVRNEKRGTGEGRFEAEELAFHQRVAEGYSVLAREFPKRICTVEADGTTEEVFERVLSALESRGALSR